MVEEASAEIQLELARRVRALVDAPCEPVPANDPDLIKKLREQCSVADSLYRERNGTLLDGSTAKYAIKRALGVGSGRLKTPRTRNSASPDTMIDRHRRIAQLAALGQTNEQIAEIVDMHPGTVGAIKRQPAVQLVTAILQRKEDAEVRNVTERIALFADEAFTVVQEAVRDNDVPVMERAKMAMKALALAGHSPVHKVAVKSMHVALTRDDVKGLLARADQCGMLAESAPNVDDALSMIDQCLTDNQCE